MCEKDPKGVQLFLILSSDSFCEIKNTMATFFPLSILKNVNKQYLIQGFTFSINYIPQLKPQLHLKLEKICLSVTKCSIFHLF